MSTKPPPPPRPDLESDSSAPPPKQPKGAPPPIPLRTDLGEGENVNASNTPVPKIPPATLPKRTGSKKLHGRPEISIISAQPMIGTGAFTPFEQHSGTKSTFAQEPESAHVPVSFPSENTKSTTAPLSSAPIPGPQSTNKPSSPSVPAPIPGPPTTTKPSSPSVAAPIPGPPIASKPAPSVTGPATTFKPATFAPPKIPGPPTAFKPATSASPPILSPPTSTKPAPSVPGPTPGPQTPIEPAPSVPGPITPSRPAPTYPQPTTAEDQTNILKPAGNSSPSLQKVPKSSKSRAPPQRPKSKPVCDPTLTGDVLSANLGIQNTEAEKPGEPVAPKRKKNKPNKTPQDSEFDPMKDFGVSNSAFQEFEPSHTDDLFQHIVVEEMKKEESSAANSKKSKPFPTVIRTKPNGKENTSTGITTTQEKEVNTKDVNTSRPKNTKPTVIKPQGKTKPPPPPSKKAKDDYAQLADEPNTDNPVQIPSTSAVTIEPGSQQVTFKSKSKPTIIIPKGKKDPSDNKDTKKSDITSPSSSQTPESNIVDNESKTSNTVEQAAKPKRMPSIIRPNRPKKGKNAPNVPQNSRGMPEGQSQETSQSQPKLMPARKAPPRPSPPKPGPPRPGPPKRTPNEPVNTQPRMPPPGTVATEVRQQEHSQKAKAPRPMTIGKDKESEDLKATEKSKKKDQRTVVSSVITTKIEPSAIALYDYVASCPDDLSFKAGDEIFLVKKINQEWYIGRCNGCEGMMPIKFVEIIEDLPPEPEQPVSSKASSYNPPSLNTMVLYDFQAQSHDELTLHAGDMVQLLEIVNGDWLKGKFNGITGIFPANFVDLSEDMKQKLLHPKKDSKHMNIGQENPQKNTNVMITSWPRCKAIYDYHTDNADDLRFDKDDIIKLVERINVEWLKGEIHGTTGMFPAAYVEIIEDLKVVPPTSSKKGASNFPVAKALHDYLSNTEGDLSFREGDMITVVGKISDEWLEGELSGHRGIFPSSFIENVGAPMQSTGKFVPQDHLLPKGRALYDFTGESDQELTFKTGDEILLLQQINEDWMEGEFNNHIGQFPSAFMEILVPLP